MLVFRRRQVVALSLILMIVVAGYLQYSYKKSSVSVSGKENGKLGEAVYVDSKSGNVEEQKNEKDGKDAKDQKAGSASKQANEFFAQAKLDKEITRSKDVDALKAITDDPNASKETKAKAYEERMKIVQNSEKEMRIETLIKEKGFSDVVAIIGDDGSLDIIVKAPNLTASQTAQIADIVSRQANVSMDKLHIKNVY